MLTLCIERLDQHAQHAGHQLQAAILQLHEQVSPAATWLSTNLNGKVKTAAACLHTCMLRCLTESPVESGALHQAVILMSCRGVLLGIYSCI